MDLADALVDLIGCEEAVVWPWAGVATEGGMLEGGGAAAFLFGAMVKVGWLVSRFRGVVIEQAEVQLRRRGGCFVLLALRSGFENVDFCSGWSM